MSLRVLHVVQAFSPLTETFLYDLVRETALRGDALVVTQRRVHAASRPFDPVRVIARSAGRVAALRDRILWSLRRDGAPDPQWIGLRRALARVARAYRPDVVHAHFGDQGVLAAPVARTLGVPLLTSFYGYDASQLPRDPRWRRSFRALVAGPNRALVLSRAMMNALASAGLARDRIFVLCTGKRLSDYPFRARDRSPARFVTVGRLVEKKGHLDAVEAFARLVADGSDVSLDIVGQGPMERDIKARIEALQLQGRVRLLGALDHGETARLMSEADAFVLCSRTAANGDQEGVPTVLMEAQALGLPCVSTRHAGIPEVIPEDNHGLLAREGDVAGIAAALRHLKAMSPVEIRATCERGLQHVQAHHDVGRQGSRLADLYHAAATGSDPSGRAFE